jgi:LAO/AO transport system kinase
MRDIDDGMPAGREDLKALYPHTGNAAIIGITGNPGCGKSTLTDKLIGRYRQANLRVGCVAVDPTSPFSGGAILADRVRMRRHYLDPGVFIRSVATRGALGGLSPAVWGIVHVMDAMGYDVILVETVGVGQDEVDIAALAHTSLVVTVPGLGDELQALKAGVLEIADIFVVNKAEKPGADRAVSALNMMLQLGEVTGDGWEIPILLTTALDGAGVDELVDAIDRHRQHMLQHGALSQRAIARAETEIRVATAALIHRRLVGLLARDPGMVEAVALRDRDPLSVAEELLATAMKAPLEG